MERNRKLKVIIDPNKDIGLKEGESYITNSNLDYAPLIKVKSIELSNWIKLSPKRFNKIFRKEIKQINQSY